MTERGGDRPGEKPGDRRSRPDPDEGERPAERRGAAIAVEVALGAVEGALELLEVAALLLDPQGRVVASNRAGHGLRDRDVAAFEAEVARARAGGEGGKLAVKAVRAGRGEPWWLVVERGPRVGIDERGRAAARRWHLTPRQTEVAVELARGRSNREIARALGCAESTVELHVTALLGKSRCQGRAELVARFWTDP